MLEDVDIWKGQGAHRFRPKESWGDRIESRVVCAVQVPIPGYTDCGHFFGFKGESWELASSIQRTKKIRKKRREQENDNDCFWTKRH